MAHILFFLGVAALALGTSHLLLEVCHGLIRSALRRAPRRLRALSSLLKATCLGILTSGVLLSGGLFGSPVYGLAFLVLVPTTLGLVVRWAAGRQSRALDSAAIAYFHALHGLIRSGLGMPYAIFRLAESVPSPFSRAMRPFLESYSSGVSLEACLERFRGKIDLRFTGICLTVLQMAYREGLPVAPFLDRILPLLETERRGRERIAALRRSVAAQALVAGLTPPFLAWALSLFQPEIGTRFLEGRFGYPLLGLAMVFEALGTVVLWKVSSFY